MQNKLGRITETKHSNEESDGPPGQFITDKFPILTFGEPPEIELSDWKFEVTGEIKQKFSLNWSGFLALPQVTVNAEFHCVTQWSKLQNEWIGVSFKTIAELVDINVEADFVMVHCYGGYSTNLPLEVLMDDDVLFAHTHEAQTLDRNHGGPLRLVVPKRYGWKSAKWVNGVEFMLENTPGFWEERGYHMNGDPWKEERFWKDLTY